MDGVFAKASTVGFLVRRGGPSQVVALVGRFWDTETRYLGLRRDLTAPFDAPRAKVAISVRPLIESDVDALLQTSIRGLPHDELALRYWQKKIVKAEIPTCYVAVTDDGRPCYMQWLIGADHMEQAKSFYGRQFPDIGPDEAILEGAFTPAEFRGQGIMPCAMAQITEKAAALGARRVITFVADDNTPALKGCQRAGFRPFLERNRRWHHFRRHFSSVPLAEGSRYPYEMAAGPTCPPAI
jgi:RimJ/RimL family protein N-acetyltransferase